jgi:hypothetical protein
MGVGERLSAAWRQAMRGREYDLAPRAIELPVTARATLKGSLSVALGFLMVAAALFAWGSVWRFGDAPAFFGPVLLLLAACVFAGAAYLALLGIFGSETWHFGDSLVTCRSRGLLRRRTWQEPLSAYRGIVVLRGLDRLGTGAQYRSIVHLQWGRATQDTRYCVQAEHSHSRQWDVPLYASSRADDLHDKARHYGRLLGLAVLFETEDGTAVLAPEDVDEGVDGRVRAGRISPAPTTEGPPGGKPALTVDGQSLRMRCPHGALRPVVLMIPVASVAASAVFGLVPRLWLPVHWLAGIFLLVSMLGGLCLWSVGEELQVSADRVTRCWTWLGLRFGVRSVGTDRIRDVMSAEQFSDARFCTVQIVSPGLVLQFGRSLKPEQRRWVRDCIIAAIGRGPSADGA